jgi:membrane-associated phospholipid phosphatase
MLKIIEKNRLYFGLYLLCFWVVFATTATTEKLTATYYFSNHRTAFGDFFFRNWTYLGEAYPFILGAIIAIVQKHPRLAWKIGTAGTTALIIVGLLKDFFDMPRPGAVLETLGLTTSINYVAQEVVLKGLNSFPSGHTAAAFALWSLLAFQFPKFPRLQVLFLLTAVLVGVSRVYLVQHFPADTLLGSAIGISVALLTEYFFEQKMVKTAKKTAKIVPLPNTTTPSVM